MTDYPMLRCARTVTAAGLVLGAALTQAAAAGDEKWTADNGKSYLLLHDEGRAEWFALQGDGSWKLHLPNASTTFRYAKSGTRLEIVAADARKTARDIYEGTIDRGTLSVHRCVDFAGKHAAGDFPALAVGVAHSEAEKLPPSVLPCDAYPMVYRLDSGAAPPAAAVRGSESEPRAATASSGPPAPKDTWEHDEQARLDLNFRKLSAAFGAKETDPRRVMTEAQEAGARFRKEPGDVETGLRAAQDYALLGNFAAAQDVLDKLAGGDAAQQERVRLIQQSIDTGRPARKLDRLKKAADYWRVVISITQDLIMSDKYDEAMRWLQPCIDGGYGLCSLQAGRLELTRAHFHSGPKVVAWFRRGAEQGDIEAMYLLPLNLLEGKDARNNEAEVKRWNLKLWQLANAGDGAAMNAIASWPWDRKPEKLYPDEFRGATASLAKKNRWQQDWEKKAIAVGDTDALVNSAREIGHWASEGGDVSYATMQQKYPQVVAILEKAAGMGNVQAMIYLHQFAEHGKDVERSRALRAQEMAFGGMDFEETFDPQFALVRKQEIARQLGAVAPNSPVRASWGVQ